MLNFKKKDVFLKFVTFLHLGAQPPLPHWHWGRMSFSRQAGTPLYIAGWDRFLSPSSTDFGLSPLVQVICIYFGCLIPVCDDWFSFGFGLIFIIKHQCFVFSLILISIVTVMCNAYILFWFLCFYLFYLSLYP